jgi:alcohol dehydrogenase (cytochrome c)
VRVIVGTGAITAAPLVVKDVVITGITGGEHGIRGFLDAYDLKPASGGRFDTIPAPGEKGSETWKGGAWQRDGAPTWVTGSYDPKQMVTTSVGSGLFTFTLP